MIRRCLSTALAESVADVLEKMFFVGPMGEPESLPTPDGSVMSAEVTFWGNPSGTLTLRVTHDVARSIGADFLGEDEEALSEKQIGDVICELANMICGSVLSRAESATTFRLEKPSITTPEPWHDLSDQVICYAVALGNGSLTAILETEPPSCRVDEKFAS